MFILFRESTLMPFVRLSFLIHIFSITMKTFRGLIVGLKTHTYNIINTLGLYVKGMLHLVRLFYSNFICKKLPKDIDRGLELFFLPGGDLFFLKWQGCAQAFGHLTLLLVKCLPKYVPYYTKNRFRQSEL